MSSGFLPTCPKRPKVRSFSLWRFCHDFGNDNAARIDVYRSDPVGLPNLPLFGGGLGMNTTVPSRVKIGSEANLKLASRLPAKHEERAHGLA